VGTPAYVAPEQRAGAVAHPAADVYSFAVALVEATLGYHPMPASGDRWKSALRGRVSGRVHRELCSAIASDPRQRTQSLAPLLDSLAVRRDGRRRFAAAVVLASAAVGVAIALTWHRTPSALSELRPLSGSPSELFREATELLAVPAERRDDRWSERTRSLVMLPIPARVPCRWPAAQRTVAFAEDTIVMLDVQDRVVSCEISTGIVSILASDVICLRPTDDDTVFGLAFRDGRIALYHRRGRSEAGRDAGAEAGRNAGWSELDAPALAGYADGARPNALCHFFVSSQGIVPPQISLSGPNAGLPADRLAVRAGDRRLTVTADAGLVSQTGDLPPQLLVAPPVERFRVDDALHVGLVVSAGRVGIVDATTGSVVAETPAGSPRLEHSSIDLSRDGSAAVALWIDGPLLWWRRGERQWHRQPVTISGTDVRVSPRGERALTLDVIGRLDVYELAAGRRHPLADAQIQMAAFLDDDHVVAIDSTGSVWRWSLAQLRASVLADHPAPAGTNLWGFAVCDSERSVVTATNGTDAGIEVSSPSGAPRMALSVPPGTQIYGIACRGDRILAGTIDGHVLEWEWPTRRLLAEHDVGVRSWIWAIATAQPAGGPRVDLFGTGNTRAQPRSGGHVVALRGGALTQIFTASLSGNTGIDDIAVSADGQRVAIVASSGQLAVADVASGTTTPPVHAHNEEARRVRFTDADRSLITGGDDGSLRAWRVDDLAMESQINLGNGPIYDLDVHGSIAVAATRNGHVGTWDVAARQMIRAYRGHTAPVGVVRFDPSGQWIASGDFAGRLCVYRADRERCYVELTGHKPVPIRHLQFLRDGQLVTASDDGTVRQWAPPYDAPDSELACELETRLADPERIDCAAR
jgi:WD40 repeat protein